MLIILISTVLVFLVTSVAAFYSFYRTVYSKTFLRACGNAVVSGLLMGMAHVSIISFFYTLEFINHIN